MGLISLGPRPTRAEPGFTDGSSSSLNTGAKLSSGPLILLRSKLL